jgi:L-seryl-tRNA(Ser) seleniumtransferase
LVVNEEDLEMSETPEETSPLRQLPRVDDLLVHPRMTAIPAPHALALKAAREAVAETRSRLLAGESSVDASADAVALRAAELLERAAARSLRRAVNATGVLLHTNLGRAPLSDAAQQALAEVAGGFSNLQADLGSGRRSEREDHVQGLFQTLTSASGGQAGAEAALVVNNNAAATVLVLNTLAAGREVIVSRGEMVEIGGAFRIPEILKLAGCRLVEVGCTNRTHLRDYERAITPETGLILSVHQSNYRIVGFAEQVGIAELAQFAREKKIPCAHDLGSGALLDLRAYGLPHEPTVPESLAAGADATLFSGDKLLGGPQCGIILGKKAPLAAMHKNPFYRAFRVGKLTLAALEATLRLFLEPEMLLEKHRLMSLLTAPLDGIRRRAESLAQEIAASCANWLSADSQPAESEIGGGSLAGYPIPTVVVRLRPKAISPDDLAARLRQADPPIFTRVQEGCVVLDVRTMLAGEERLIVPALNRIKTGTS